MAEQVVDSAVAGLTKSHRAILSFPRRLLREKPLGAIGGALVLLVLISGTLADFLAPFPYAENHLVDRLTAPSVEYLLGTDQLGRDLLSRIIFGARVSMYVGFGAVALAMSYALILGMTSAWFGGTVDTIIGRFIDVKMAIPTLLLLLVVSSILGPGLINIIVVLSLFGINEARVVRGQTLSIKENAYIDAARSLGSNSWRILTRHVVPNLFAPVVILASLRFGSVILAESTLSFLGYGIPPPFPSWGRMLSSEARYHMEQAPWLAIAPGLALTMAVWGFNVLGDAVRDLLDPRLRGTGGGGYR